MYLLVYITCEGAINKYKSSWKKFLFFKENKINTINMYLFSEISIYHVEKGDNNSGKYYR